MGAHVTRRDEIVEHANRTSGIDDSGHDERGIELTPRCHPRAGLTARERADTLSLECKRWKHAVMTSAVAP